MSDTNESSNRWGGLIELQPQQLVQIALLGLGVGAALWLVTLLVRHVVFAPLFCGDPTNGLCVGATANAGAFATIIAAIVGLLGLVRMSVYRPLLIVIAVAISIWGLSTWVADLPWFEGLAWSVLLYAVGYVAFAWLVRPRSFAPMIIMVIIAVILIRWLPVL